MSRGGVGVVATYLTGGQYTCLGGGRGSSDVPCRWSVYVSRGGRGSSDVPYRWSVTRGG